MGGRKRIRLWIVLMPLLILPSGCTVGNRETEAADENKSGISFQNTWIELQDLKERPVADFWNEYLYYLADEGQESGKNEIRRMDLTTGELETLSDFLPVAEGRVPLLLHLRQDGGILLLDEAAEGLESL